MPSRPPEIAPFRVNGGPLRRERSPGLDEDPHALEASYTPSGLLQILEQRVRPGRADEHRQLLWILPAGPAPELLYPDTRPRWIASIANVTRAAGFDSYLVRFLDGHTGYRTESDAAPPERWFEFEAELAYDIVRYTREPHALVAAWGVPRRGLEIAAEQAAKMIEEKAVDRSRVFVLGSRVGHRAALMAQKARAHFGLADKPVDLHKLHPRHPHGTDPHGRELRPYFLDSRSAEQHQGDAPEAD